MSLKQTVTSSSTKGKGGTIVTPATQPTSTAVEAAIAVSETPEEDIFILAGKLEALLKGKSNKTVLKALNMVGSLHGVRSIPADRPIGQSTTGTIRKVVAAKPEKGKPTPPAAWKQTDDYRRLSAEREKIVKTIKSRSSEELSKTTLVEDLRALEQQLKALKSSTPGNF
jgi:hypothetical protein